MIGEPCLTVGLPPRGRNEVAKCFAHAADKTEQLNNTFVVLVAFELVEVSALLQESGPESLESRDSSFNQQKLKVVGSIAVLSTISLALIALLVGIVVLMIGGYMPLLAGGFLLTFMTGISIGFVCLGLASLKKLEPEKQKQLKKNPATVALIQQGMDQPLLSVTEHTTELLEDPKQRHS